MRILAFTFEAPSKLYGGGLGIIQTMASLSAFAELDYVGPFFEQKDFLQIKLHNAIFLKNNNPIPVKAINLFRGVTTRYYQQWKAAVKKLNPKDYDLVFVDFSYNDFIMDWAHANNLKVVVRVHNIEQDMSANSAHGKVHDKYWFRNVVNGWLINKREARMMAESEHLIFLTREDRNRACELYGNDILNRSSIVPVCMDVSEQEKMPVDLPTPYILATGSLFYGPNAEGIKWLLANVWEELQKENRLPSVSLVIAGRKPDAEMEAMVQKAENCTLIASPEDMTPYFQNASLYVAPVFSGAGMKVKVAEALSYGLTVIGAKHALIGYEESVPFCIEANAAEEFKTEILRYFSIEHDEAWKKACQEKFCQLYTMKRSAQDFEQVMNAVLM